MKPKMTKQEKFIEPETSFEQFIIDFFKWGTIAAILAVFIGILYAAYQVIGFYGPLIAIAAFVIYFWTKSNGGRHAQH
jgi:L-asparagine transporter-like permease